MLENKELSRLSCRDPPRAEFPEGRKGPSAGNGLGGLTPAASGGISACIFRDVYFLSTPKSVALISRLVRSTARVWRHQQCFQWAPGGFGTWLSRAVSADCAKEIRV